MINCHPDLVGGLRGEIVKPECGEQAHDSLGDSVSRLDEGGVLGSGEIQRGIETAADLFEVPPASQRDRQDVYVIHLKTKEGLLRQVFNLYPKTFKQLKRGSADFWIKRIDITGYQQAQLHSASYGSLRSLTDRKHQLIMRARIVQLRLQ